VTTLGFLLSQVLSPIYFHKLVAKFESKCSNDIESEKRHWGIFYANFTAFNGMPYLLVGIPTPGMLWELFAFEK
jgi:hypothetical protein